MSSAAPTIKAALIAAITAAVGPDVLVCYGPPGPYQPDDIVSVGAIRSTSALGTLSLARTRHESLEVDVTISCYRGGDTEVQQTVTERAYTLLATIEAQLQSTDPTLGGLAWGNAAVVGHSLAEEAFEMGRVAEIVATLTLHATI